MPSFLLRRQDFFFLSFLFFSFEQCTSTKILLRVAIFFFKFRLVVGVLVYFNLLCLPFSSVKTDCQPQSSLLVEVGCKSQGTQPLPHARAPR